MNLLEKIFIRFVSCILGLYLATNFVPSVDFTGSLEIFFFCGFALALINLFLKPFLKKLLFILRLITLGLFDFVIEMGMVWLLDILFPELEIIGIKPLFLTTIVIVIINFIFKAKS